ncbi:DUF3558 domain-containing protein [Kibdelosporangium philippinense]
MASGCTTSQGGTPTPSSNTGSAAASTSATTSGNDSEAPRVSVPLDASKFLSQPCAILAPAQLKDLNLQAQGKPDTDSQIAKTSGPSCSWRNSDASANSVSFTTGNKNGLSDTYRAHRQGQFGGYFEPTDVTGYPAVFRDIKDFRNNGTCNLTVGISDTLTFLVTEQGPLKGAASCDRAKQVASLVIETLKRGG